MPTRAFPSLLLALVLAAFVAWLGFTAACLYDRAIPLCRHPAGGWIVIIAAMVVVIFPLASLARERARRQIGRGLYARPAGFARPLEAAARAIGPLLHLAWEGELPRGDGRGADHPALIEFEGRGWWVNFDNGRQVWVDKQAFYDWLADCWLLQQRYQKRKEPRSALAQRRWEPEIGRWQWQARCWLVDLAGATERNTADRRSTPQLNHLPWETVLKIEAVYPSEPRLR